MMSASKTNPYTFINPSSVVPRHPPKIRASKRRGYAYVHPVTGEVVDASDFENDQRAQKKAAAASRKNTPSLECEDDDSALDVHGRRNVIPETSSDSDIGASATREGIPIIAPTSSSQAVIGHLLRSNLYLLHTTIHYRRVRD